MSTQFVANVAGEFSVSALIMSQPVVIALLRRLALCHALLGLETGY